MLYAAYGSNLNIEQMAHRCPDAYPVCRAVLKDWSLVFNTHLDIVESAEFEVPVLLWEVSDLDIEALDIYEGYPKYYVKEIVTVEKEDGTTTEAMVYVMSDHRKGIYPPRMHYFNTCLQGYRENHMNPESLYDALIESLEVAEYECESGRLSGYL